MIYLDEEIAEIQNSCYGGADLSPAALLESVFDKFGDQGWELSSVITVPSKSGANRSIATAFFKGEVVTGADVGEPAPPA